MWFCVTTTVTSGLYGVSNARMNLGSPMMPNEFDLTIYSERVISIIEIEKWHDAHKLSRHSSGTLDFKRSVHSCENVLYVVRVCCVDKLLGVQCCRLYFMACIAQSICSVTCGLPKRHVHFVCMCVP